MPYIKCAQCSKKVYKIPSRMNEAKYCSNECRLAAQSNPPIEVICEYCGQKFLRRPSDMKERTFCSQECYKANGRIIVKCARCSTEVERWKSQVKGHTVFYCSRECLDRASGDPPIERTCKSCGRKFMARAYKVKNGEAHFCCRECKLEYMRGPNSSNWKGGWEYYYGPDWNRAKKKARKRVGYKCEKCDKPQSECDRALDVHHKIPVRNFENPNDAHFQDNLIVLCRECHKIEEVNGYKELPLFALGISSKSSSKSTICLNCGDDISKTSSHKLCRSCSLSFYHFRNGHDSIFPHQLGRQLIELYF